MERPHSQSPDSLHCWTLTDGNAGNRRQASALASALMPDAGDIRDLVLDPHAPWRWLAPRRLPAAASAFGPDFAGLLARPPRIAIGCGRQAALATRLLRERGTQAIQILDPRIDPSHWDLVVAPEHDGLGGGNVVALLGSLNPVDDAWLDAARARFAAFAALPSPRTALLLGGDSAHFRFTADAFDALAAMLETALARDGGSLLATASRRTPGKIAGQLRARFANRPGVVWRDPSDGENPYPGLLAWADRIVCTPDSVNMVSEACATRAPVYVFRPRGVEGRLRAFLESLLGRGRIRALDPALAPFDVEPLRETARVAEIVKARLAP